MLESVIALVTPYAAFVLAESVHASGVTAVVVAAILLGTQAARLTTAHIRLQLAAVNATVIFILESVVFGLIGLQLPTLIRSLAGTDTAWLLPSLVIAGMLIAGPDSVGVPADGDHAVAQRRASAVLAGPRGGRMGRHAGGCPLGGSAVHPAHRRRWNAAA